MKVRKLVGICALAVASAAVTPPAAQASTSDPTPPDPEGCAVTYVRAVCKNRGDVPKSEGQYGHFTSTGIVRFAGVGPWEIWGVYTNDNGTTWTGRMITCPLASPCVGGVLVNPGSDVSVYVDGPSGSVIAGQLDIAGI
jgi:hypothetical protein